MGTRLATFVAFIVGSLVLASCSADTDDLVDDNFLGTATQELDAAHTRVVQECSQAMSGSWNTYNATNWPTGATYATYAYTSADAGAWNLLLDNTYNGSVRGWWTSCKKTLADAPQYTPCNLVAGTGYGDLDTPISNFTCQGNCASATYKRGGQCKPFMNLVAYRSGLYQNSGYQWKSFPSDTCIAYTTASCNLATKVTRPANDANMPLATYANIIEGDYLRMPYDHAAIVVRKIDSLNVVVLDSNWLPGSGGTGNGKEIVGSHVMGFTGTGTHSDLGAYRVLKCAYTGAC